VKYFASPATGHFNYWQHLEKSCIWESKWFLNLDNMLTKEQFGFRKILSRDKAMYIFIDETLCALNSKVHSGRIFCDIAKAFDWVNHDILLLKLKVYGIQGKVEW